jgi:hypothetical protein
VYSKACLSRAATVVKYLGRYTRKGMLHESRIKAVTTESVSFSYTDYADGNKRKVMRLDAKEFIRRYLLHVLPKGVMRVRHLGFLANACKRKKLAAIRPQLPLLQGKPDKCIAAQDCQWRCPKCEQGYLLFVGVIKPQLLALLQKTNVPLRLTG